MLSLSELAQMSTHAVENSYCLFYFRSKIHVDLIHIERLSSESGKYFVVTTNQTHRRLLVVLSDLDMIPLNHSHVIRVCNLFLRYQILLPKAVRHYTYIFYHTIGPTSHLFPCAMILTASFYFEKLLAHSLFQNFPR